MLHVYCLPYAYEQCFCNYVYRKGDNKRKSLCESSAAFSEDNIRHHRPHGRHAHQRQQHRHHQQRRRPRNHHHHQHHGNHHRSCPPARKNLLPLLLFILLTSNHRACRCGATCLGHRPGSWGGMLFPMAGFGGTMPFIVITLEHRIRPEPNSLPYKSPKPEP